MNINKKMRQYYQEKINSHKVPQSPDFLFGNRQFVERKLTPLLTAPRFLFHMGVVAALAIVLLINGSTLKQLQTIDPHNEHLRYWKHKIEGGLKYINAYFGKIPAGPRKGEKK